MIATARTSAGVRDITAIATRLIREDKLFQQWRTDQLQELAGHGPFLQALGRAIAAKIDWEEVAYQRGKLHHNRAH